MLAINFGRREESRKGRRRRERERYLEIGLYKVGDASNHRMSLVTVVAKKVGCIISQPISPFSIIIISLYLAVLLEVVRLFSWISTIRPLYPIGRMSLHRGWSDDADGIIILAVS